jgi:hypothetical protein
MKYPVFLLATGIILGSGGGSNAQEPYLEYVQGLRAKGLARYALDYLENVGKNPPGELAKVLLLEKAKARSDVAQLETDTHKRETLYTQAQEELTVFLQKNADSPLAPEATMELGRILARRGKVLVGRADRLETPEARRPDLNRAQAQFQEAAKRLEEAAGMMAKQLSNKDLDPKIKTALTKIKPQLELEQGINYLDLFLTYEELETKERPKIAKKALETLQKVGGGDDKNPLYWVARAWIGKYHYETQDFSKSAAELDKVIKAAGPQTEPGKRLAHYFHLLVVDKEPNPKKDLLAAKIKEAEDWLKDYPSYANTPEGFGVRFQLAEGLLAQALKRPKTAQNTSELQQLFTRAEKLFEALEKPANDYSRQARERKLNIIVTRSGERTRGDINKLVNFQECFLRSQLEVFYIGEDERKPPKDAKPEDLKKKRHQHVENIVKALNRALELADAKSPPEEVNEARYLLTFVYHQEMNDPYRAAILGEHLARTQPEFSRAGAAAGYALQAYSTILAEDESNEGNPKDVEASRRRLQDLAAYMEKTWPTDPATDGARHRVANLFYKQKKYPEAIAVLSKISPSYELYSFSQFDLANAALQALKDNIHSPKGQPSYQEQAIQALKKIPELAAGADPRTSHYYFLAKLRLAGLLFATKQYDQMGVLTDQLTKRYSDVKAELDDDAKKEIEQQLQIVPVYAQYGKAEIDFRAGKFEEVRKTVDPLVDQVVQNKLQDLKDPQMIRLIFGLALRVNVRQGQTKRAQEILELLLNRKAQGELEGTAAVLGDLVLQLRGQIEELRQQGKAATEELAKTVASLTAFLDEVSKQPEEKLTPELVRFLAFSYGGLQKHQEAAALLERIRIPKTDAQDKNGDQEKLAQYRGMQIMLVRELRLSKQYDQARDKLKALLGSSWGSKNLDVKKELNSLWEDEEKFAAAGKAWNDMMSSLRPLIDKNPKYKDLYFECYYHLVFCIYKNALLIQDKTKKEEGIQRAANLIVTLQQSKPDMGGEGLKKQYDDLLEKETVLKSVCDGILQPAGTRKPPRTSGKKN